MCCHGNWSPGFLTLNVCFQILLSMSAWETSVTTSEMLMINQWVSGGCHLLPPHLYLPHWAHIVPHQPVVTTTRSQWLNRCFLDMTIVLMTFGFFLQVRSSLPICLWAWTLASVVTALLIMLTSPSTPCQLKLTERSSTQSWSSLSPPQLRPPVRPTFSEVILRKNTAFIFYGLPTIICDMLYIDLN